jgi:hypothetical protein
MESSVENFMNNFKREHWGLNQTPRKLVGLEVPPPLASALVCAAPSYCPKNLTRAFDMSRYYESHPTPLTGRLPDGPATRRFREYLAKNREPIPGILEEEVAVEEPKEVRSPSSRRMKRRPPLYVK